MTEQKTQNISVNLSFEEIQQIMCEECRRKLRELIAKKVAEKLVV
jgi:hypothetical protein